MEATRERVAALRFRQVAIERAAADTATAPSLHAVLRGQHVAVIAEVKRRSPSRGAINKDLVASVCARAYAAGGARAISVLTEPVYFGGANQDLLDVAGVTGIPTIKKDFHIDSLQIVEARALNASGLLLIARALKPGLLAHLVRTALAMDVEPVVEVRTETELHAALDAGARVIGVNSRNLETLVVDREVLKRLIPLVPGDCIAIAESGMRGLDDVISAGEHGVDAVLIGTYLSTTTDPERAVRGLSNVPRRTRHD
ncbi:MAG: indole-3-glycerol phosphate synthase TrpC [Gemmatimonadaceae bacterium]